MHNFEPLDAGTVRKAEIRSGEQPMAEPVLHHATRPPTHPGDLYDTVFASGVVGDWYWTEIEIDGAIYRALHIIIPDLAGRSHGLLGERGLELIQVFPMRQPDDWAEPGPVDAWDHNDANPTLSPSILIPGGWHGYFEHGQLRSA